MENIISKRYVNLYLVHVLNNFDIKHCLTGIVLSSNISSDLYLNYFIIIKHFPVQSSLNEHDLTHKYYLLHVFPPESFNFVTDILLTLSRT